MLAGERKALVCALLSFYMLLYLLVAFNPSMPDAQPMFAAMAGLYGLSFFALIAGYFWARWYSIGLGVSGAATGGIVMLQIGPEPVIVVYTLTHMVIAAFLWGGGMAKKFDGRREWRARMHLDDSGADRLGKAITRVGMSLPYIIMYALAPKNGSMTTLGGQYCTSSLLIIFGLLCVGAGIWALLRARTWGLFAVLASAAALAASLFFWGSPESAGLVVLGKGSVFHRGIGLVAVALLTTAIVPFVVPVARYLRRAGD